MKQEREAAESVRRCTREAPRPRSWRESVCSARHPWHSPARGGPERGGSQRTAWSRSLCPVIIIFFLKQTKECPCAPHAQQESTGESTGQCTGTWGPLSPALLGERTLGARPGGAGCGPGTSHAAAPREVDPPAAFWGTGGCRLSRPGLEEGLPTRPLTTHTPKGCT